MRSDGRLRAEDRRLKGGIVPFYLQPKLLQFFLFSLDFPLTMSKMSNLEFVINSISKSSAIFVGVVVGFLNVCTIRLVASS